jgi:hypothetical protein
MAILFPQESRPVVRLKSIEERRAREGSRPIRLARGFVAVRGVPSAGFDSWDTVQAVAKPSVLRWLNFHDRYLALFSSSSGFGGFYPC